MASSRRSHTNCRNPHCSRGAWHYTGYCKVCREACEQVTPGERLLNAIQQVADIVANNEEEILDSLEGTFDDVRAELKDALDNWRNVSAEVIRPRLGGLS